MRLTTLTGLGVSVSSSNLFAGSRGSQEEASNGKRLDIIGLDISHSRVFTQLINSGDVSGGYKVVAEYPQGSPDIPSAIKMRPQITEAVKNMGIEIVDSIEDLLTKGYVVLLETNDGRPHYEQALPVLQSGKRMFIDKPVAHNLKDTKRIYAASRQYGSPIFR